MRVIAFRSVNEYQPYRLQVASDAYYVSAEGRDYIVMPSAGAEEFRVAAHEYAHSLLHSSRPAASAVAERGAGGVFFHRADRGARQQDRRRSAGAHATLRQMPWLPLDQLLAASGEASPREDRERTACSTRKAGRSPTC